MNDIIFHKDGMRQWNWQHNILQYTVHVIKYVSTHVYILYMISVHMYVCDILHNIMYTVYSARIREETPCFRDTLLGLALSLRKS